MLCLQDQIVRFPNETDRAIHLDMGPKEEPPQRTAPFDAEPGYYAPAALWLYGNVKLLHGSLSHVAMACGPSMHSRVHLDTIEAEAEEIVLSHRILVCGFHSPAHQRAAIVPLRWGSPRIVVMSGGFFYHLGEKLDQEPFRAARLWRYCFDPKTDLAISRRAPDKLPTYARHNPTVDRLIRAVAEETHRGLSRPTDLLTRPLAQWT